MTSFSRMELTKFILLCENSVSPSFFGNIDQLTWGYTGTKSERQNPSSPDQFILLHAWVHFL
jgi:hypothetical protein